MTDPAPVFTARKKPSSIDLCGPWDGTAEGATPIIDWVLGLGGTASYDDGDPDAGIVPTIRINTIDSTGRVLTGDYIARGLKGEFYPLDAEAYRLGFETEADAPVEPTEVEVSPDLKAEIIKVLQAQRPGRLTEDVYNELEPLLLSADANARAWGARYGATAAIDTAYQDGYSTGRMHATRVAEDEDGAPLPGEVQNTRRFFLWRSTDITEVTVRPGEEPRAVAIGVLFSTGIVALHWPGGGGGSTAVWPTIDAMRDTHLHPRSQTELVWVD